MNNHSFLALLIALSVLVFPGYTSGNIINVNHNNMLNNNYSVLNFGLFYITNENNQYESDDVTEDDFDSYISCNDEIGGIIREINYYDNNLQSQTNTYKYSNSIDNQYLSFLLSYSISTKKRISEGFSLGMYYFWTSFSKYFANGIGLQYNNFSFDSDEYRTGNRYTIGIVYSPRFYFFKSSNAIFINVGCSLDVSIENTETNTWFYSKSESETMMGGTAELNLGLQESIVTVLFGYVYYAVPNSSIKKEFTSYRITVGFSI